jgi:hypothetical protein
MNVYEEIVLSFLSVRRLVHLLADQLDARHGLADNIRAGQGLADQVRVSSFL